MYYIDTSVLAAYYCPEPLSEKVEEYMLGNDQPVISNLVEVELCSAISRKVREGGMKKNDAGQIIKEFLSHLDEGFYIKLPIESHHYRLAREWIRQFNTALRTLDALHLAAAFSKGLTMITADKSLLKPAEILSLDVVVL
ncbi:MAG: type II toxin-antitoxin system VapC family toxin [bacterium]